jgi:biotin carboxyl carrier protein
MKTYRVTVNGEVYEVTVEEVKSPTTGVASSHVATPVPPPTPTQPVSAPQTTPKPAPPPPAPASAPAPTPAAGTGGKEIQAPMPGKILAVKAAPGDAVKSGTVLAILEAMKMENDIMAPADGTVKAVNIKVGDSVNTGDVLVVIE